MRSNNTEFNWRQKIIIEAHSTKITWLFTICVSKFIDAMNCIIESFKEMYLPPLSQKPYECSQHLFVDPVDINGLLQTKQQ